MGDLTDLKSKPEDTLGQKVAFKSFLRVHWFSIILFVVGTLFGLWQFFWPERPKLVFYSTESIKLAPANLPAGLQIFREGKRVNENIYLCRFGLANIGRQSTKDENILQPIQMQFGDNSEILDLRIDAESRSVIESKLILNPTNATLSYSILEPHDWITGTAILASKNNPTASITGTIEGQRRIGIVNSKDNKSIRKNALTTLISYGIILIPSIMLIASGWQIDNFREKWKQARFKRKLFLFTNDIIVPVILISVIVFFIVAASFVFVTTPPGIVPL